MGGWGVGGGRVKTLKVEVPTLTLNVTLCEVLVEVVESGRSLTD